jgi:conjugal transfer pilus assembly protein TraW
MSKRLATAFALMVFTLTTLARDLGAVGPVYPIAEPDMLEEITQVLKQKEASGELAKLQRESQSRAQQRVNTPPPVDGLLRTSKALTSWYDPSIVFSQAIVDDRGRTIVPAGSRRNPLDVVTLTKQMLFFDGRDPDQVAMAKVAVDRLGGKVKPILTGGSPMELMKAWQVNVFFDQEGTLVRKLGITHVPAWVSQEGKRLRIDEVVPPPAVGKLPREGSGS